MTVTTPFRQLAFPLTNTRTYVLGGIFVMGNILLPQLCHLVPEGGKIFLPIYFFTLIGAYKFGLKVGLLTALLSPLCNHLLFGMPPASILPVLFIKSSLLAVAAAWIAGRTGKISIFHIAVAVLTYQLLGGLAEWGITGEVNAALQDFRLGYPGMCIQIILGWIILQWLAKYEY